MGYAKLKRLAETLDLSEVDRFYRGMRRKIGRRGHEISCYLRAWMSKHILGVPSEAQLATKIRNDKTLRKLCGFRKAPCKSAYSKARKRLTLGGLEFFFVFLVLKAKQLGLAKGRLVAVDSTDYTAFCNGRKKLKFRSDKDARWGHSTTKGRVFGYKLHIACDAETELPLAAIVLPASRHDSIGFFPVFKKLLALFKAIWKLIADCAYDSLEIRKALHGIEALIARNGRGKFASEKPKDNDYRKRTAIERLNSRCKEELGLDNLKMSGLWSATFHGIEVLCSMLFAAIGSFMAGFKDWRSIVNLRE